jgi:site-specific recombinase XerD
MKEQSAYVRDLREWLVLRNYSTSTINAYTGALRQFLAWRPSQGLGVTFAQEDARRYLLHRYDQGRRWQTINGDYSALQKFYTHVLDELNGLCRLHPRAMYGLFFRVVRQTLFELCADVSFVPTWRTSAGCRA